MSLEDAEALCGLRDAEAIVDWCHGAGAPVVALKLGAGGVLAEVYRDMVLRVAPVSIEEAHDMIGQVKGLAPARGYRGMPRGDLDALARAVAAFSRLASIPEVREAEVNPLIVTSMSNRRRP